MNYADRIMKTGKPSDKDSEFDSAIDAIWRVESKLEVGSQSRMALYEARRAASTAKCLYRQASEEPRHEHLWEGDGPCWTCKCGAETL